MPRSFLLRIAVVAAASCSRTPPEPAGRAAAPAEVPATLRAPASKAVEPSRPALVLSAPPETPERPFRFPAADRVVAVGDLHGDLASTREALRLAGAIDAEDRWVGGKLVLVQLGDQLDRGDDEPEILRLFERLATEAARSGGAVHALNGNHELMNASGDFRYVTEDGFRDYGGARAAAFRPGSELARSLATRNTVAIVGETLFAHAGVLPEHVAYGIGRINDEVSRFLRGEAAALPGVVTAEDAPVWTRVYGAPEPSAGACGALQSVLSALSVKRLVVGHTVQKGGVSSACNERLYRVDVGLSDYYGKNRTEVLELRPSGASVLH